MLWQFLVDSELAIKISDMTCSFGPSKCISSRFHMGAVLLVRYSPRIQGSIPHSGMWLARYCKITTQAGLLQSIEPSRQLEEAAYFPVNQFDTCTNFGTTWEAGSIFC